MIKRAAQWVDDLVFCLWLAAHFRAGDPVAHELARQRGRGEPYDERKARLAVQGSIFGADGA